MVQGAGLLLLSAVAGYWALERSASHKGNLKNVGQLVGWVVVVVSLVGVACRVLSAATGGGKWCPMKGSTMCPFSSKDLTTAPAPSSK